MRRLHPVTCGFLASAAAVVNVAFLKAATHPVDPLDIEALARLDASVVPWLVISLVADLAFYLFLIPVATGLGGRVSRWAGVVYALIGAAGATILLWQWPVSLYGSDAEHFERITRVVYFGLWNGVGAMAAVLWWGAVAWHTRRTHRVFAVFTLVMGTLSLVDVTLFRFGLMEAGGGVLIVLLGLLMIWPSAAALGPLRSRREHVGLDY